MVLLYIIQIVLNLLGRFLIILLTSQFTRTPFSSLFVYSDNVRDMGNSLNHDDFMEQYEFLIKEMARITRAGRLTAIHCIDLPLFKGKMD